MTMTVAPLRLTSADVLHDRPFTHPEHSRADLNAVQHMRATLRRLLVDPKQLPERPCPLTLYTPEATGRQHRIILMSVDGLREQRDMMLVGFFGHKKPNNDHLALDAMDTELVMEFMHHPNVLSYSSLELASGDWCNLVVLNAPEGIQSWAQGQRHVYAAQQMAPKNYEHIRLHNGMISGGVLSINDAQLTRTKYYAFDSSGAWWYAVREA